MLLKSLVSHCLAFPAEVCPQGPKWEGLGQRWHREGLWGGEGLDGGADGREEQVGRREGLPASHREGGWLQPGFYMLSSLNSPQVPGWRSSAFQLQTGRGEASLSEVSIPTTKAGAPVGSPAQTPLSFPTWEGEERRVGVGPGRVRSPGALHTAPHA